MSQTNALESNEELENVPLVRMEDVQPRERNCDVYYPTEFKVEELENCDNNVDYVVNDEEDSNIGSMVSIHSEEVVYAEQNDSDGEELIVPEVIHPVTKEATVEKPKETKIKPIQMKSKPPPDSWPTLEILPGGVINRGDKGEECLADVYDDLYKDNSVDTENLMYACAKCSQSFKYLFCLVKHVKWHEDEQKKQKGRELTKHSTQIIEITKYLPTPTGKKRLVSKTLKLKARKTKVPKKS